MMKQKILKTLLVVFLVSIAAMAVDRGVNVFIFHQHQVYYGIKTFIIAVFIAAPVSFYLVSQRIDLQYIKEELVLSIDKLKETQSETARAHEKLRESEMLYRILADNQTDVISLWTAEGERRYTSPSIERVTSYTVDEVMAMGRDSHMHPDDVPIIHSLFSSLTPGGEVKTQEFRLRHKDGSDVWVEGAFQKLNDGSGGVLTTSRPIAERRAAAQAIAESEARYRMLADNANDIMIRYDLDGRLEYVSPSARQMGYVAEDLIGHLASEFIHPDDQWVAAKVGAALKAGHTLPYGDDSEQRMRRADGEWVWLQANPSPIMDANGKIIGAMSVLRDVTARRKIEDELRAKQAEADCANRAKSDFLATMSHEIRTPLNGVLGMVQAMDRDPLPPAQRERLKLIGQSGEALLTILNDILDLSKIEAGKLELEQADFDLGSMVEGVLDTFQPIAAGKDVALRIDFEADAHGVYSGDRLRVRQVLNNLVSNALKFTHQGEVRLQVDRIDSVVQFRISDTGIGITSDQIGRLFDKFEQADSSTTRRFGGTGLGLAICKELCMAMGGDVTASSQVDEGSCFTVKLPLRRVGAADASLAEITTPKPVFDERPLRILAAEDNGLNQLVLKTLLEQAGLAPIIVGNGHEAVVTWEQDDWDLILMDVQMPVMDGVTATRIIRQREAETGRTPTPIIALTANAMTHQGAAYEAAGMNGVVAKPVQVAQLFAAIAAAIEPAAEPAAMSA